MSFLVEKFLLTVSAYLFIKSIYTQRQLFIDVASINQCLKKKGIKLQSQLFFEKRTSTPKLSVNLIVLLFGFIYVYMCISTWICAIEIDLVTCSFLLKGLQKSKY